MRSEAESIESSESFCDRYYGSINLERASLYRVSSGNDLMCHCRGDFVGGSG